MGDRLARLDDLLRFFEKKSGSVPTFAGWYSDPDTGGTKYWDGSRWTGDTRPRRKALAAPAGYQFEGIGLLGFSGMLLLGSPFAGELNDGSVPTLGLFFFLFVSGLAGSAAGVYLLRGQGPTTQAVQRRLAEEAKSAKAKRRTANLAGFAANLGGVARSHQPTATPGNDAAAAAQINAITNPETARALQNLQNLLYTQAITDEEYQGAKDMLFRTHALTDSFAHIEKLAELHRAGILGDVEFSAAKAKALGL